MDADDMDLEPTVAKCSVCGKEFDLGEVFYSTHWTPAAYKLIGGERHLWFQASIVQEDRCLNCLPEDVRALALEDTK